MPNDNVLALALGTDGALWVGTHGGLAKLDRGGQWQTFTKANTNGGLPDNIVSALALGTDGALWVGTEGGLARLTGVGEWRTYTKANTNGGLPNDSVLDAVMGRLPDHGRWGGCPSE